MSKPVMSALVVGILAVAGVPSSDRLGYRGRLGGSGPSGAAARSLRAAVAVAFT